MGFKVWAMCADSGLLHDFDVYQGKSADKKKPSEFGLGGDVIVERFQSTRTTRSLERIP